MYYNSNKHNNDYYNSYKRELQELKNYEKEERIQNYIKLGLYTASLLLFVGGSFFLYKYFYPNIPIRQHNLNNNKTNIESEKLPPIVISEKELPLSRQLQDEARNMPFEATDTLKKEKIVKAPITAKKISKKDIALIVQIIMSQMNTQKELPLEEQLNQVDKQTYKTQSLEKVNHYNKIILTSNQNDKIKNSGLVKLSNEINTIVNEPIEDESTYTNSLKKEIKFRTNEMRVIIVKKGDTLSRIAKKAYGDYDAYPKIFSANPEIIKNPNEIFVGMRLRVPS
jgi:LysM repeat protein